MKRFLLPLLAALVFLPLLLAQPPVPMPDDPPKKADDDKHGKGYVPASDEQKAIWHEEAYKRHGKRVANFPKTTAPTWDCRTLGYVLPTDDQGQCGSCYGVSAADGCSMVLIKAGQLPNDASKGRLSSQYGLDNARAFQGGCNGGDEAQVIDFIKKTGFPLTSDYGPYTASPARLKPLTGMKIYAIADWGYCTPSQQSGVAATQDIKNCMVQYGPISIAGDAGHFNSYSWPGVISGSGRSVDHAILLIGWDDSKGAWLAMNQWGTSWGGPNCTAWIKYGADSWGTEAIWMTATPVPPPDPIPPGPIPPGPIPPTPGTTTIVSVTALMSDGRTQVLTSAPTKDTTLEELFNQMIHAQQIQGAKKGAKP